MDGEIEDTIFLASQCQPSSIPNNGALAKINIVIYIVSYEERRGLRIPLMYVVFMCCEEVPHRRKYNDEHMFGLGNVLHN